MFQLKFKLKPFQEDNFIEKEVEFKLKNNSSKGRTIKIEIG